MATYYDLFAEQRSRPIVSVPYVDAFGTGMIKSAVRSEKSKRSKISDL